MSRIVPRRSAASRSRHEQGKKAMKIRVLAVAVVAVAVQ